ncbi:MAG: phospho-N-acetylmuramoyl-pentapeptide-transferase [Candidatus Omnitrophica bacterium]|nr:phospho-N-acetylmuramoyl-pentapeptide-transferase [Candidatus Omnitrophota bacterium]
MLYHLLYPLRELWFGFNVFKYITFRAAMASITAFALSIFFGPLVIKMLTHLKIGQNIRKKHVENLYELTKHKAGTPTMGGFLILLSVILSTAIWARLDNKFVVLCMISMLWLGLVGFIDDYIKLIKERSRGLRASTKFIGQIIIGLVIALFIFFNKEIMPTVCLPFFKDVAINLGLFYILFVVLVIVASSNAVNITDGLDGLAVGCVTIIALTFAIISYVTGHVQVSDYLNVYYLAGSGEIAIFCMAIVGAGLGFLWFNSHPAQVFMGDTGSLALGGAIGIVSVIIKKEILLIFVGGIFVVEVLSVILQVLSVKITGKKIFLMTPLHHHFQLLNISESKIIIRFWIVAIMLALLTLATLKLR